MGNRPQSQAIHRRVQQRMSKEDLTRLGEYSVQQNGGAVAATIPAAACNLLDISTDDEVEIFIDVENNGLVICKQEATDE